MSSLAKDTPKSYVLKFEVFPLKLYTFQIDLTLNNQTNTKLKGFGVKSSKNGLNFFLSSYFTCKNGKVVLKEGVMAALS